MIRMFECEVCGAHPSDGTTTYRVNPKGVPAINRCKACMETPVPPDLEAIVEVVEQTGRKTGD